MKRLLVLLLVFTSVGWSQRMLSDGSGFFKTFWRDSAGVIVSVPAGKLVKLTLPSAGSSGYWTRGTAPNSGTVRVSTTTDTTRAAYGIFDNRLVVGTTFSASPGGSTSLLTLHAASSASRLALTSGDANTSSRNWGFTTNQADWGDFAIMQSASQTGGPFDGTTRLNISPVGNIGIGFGSTSPATTGRLQAKSSNAQANIFEGYRSASATAVIKADTLGGIAASIHLADTSSFDAALVRKAIYISGATANDSYAVTIRNTGEVLPVAGDLPAAYAKTDSLIVNRAAGTTANLKFSYIRMKH